MADVSLLIIFSLIVIPMLVIGLFLLNGKGAFLIAGYNTMSEKEKARYDTKALCRSVGWLLIALSVCTALVPVGITFDEIPWLIPGDVALTSMIIVGYLIYANTGNRFHKNEVLSTGQGGEVRTPPVGLTVPLPRPRHSPTGTSKGTLIATAVILAITGIAVGVVFFFGARDPVVNVLDNGIQIKALYGLTVDFSDVADISLKEESMSDLGVDEKTNAYAAGGTQKGHFRSDNLGKILLFVKSRSAPTIQIERIGKEDIYISFPDGEKTRALYLELAEAFSSR